MNQREETNDEYYGTDVDKVIASASEGARASGLLNIIFLEADNGNYMSLVVGGDETVLCFNYGHQDPPYYASQGKDRCDVTAHRLRPECQQNAYIWDINK